MTLDELKENFAFLSGWEEKYAYLIELGTTLPPMTESEKDDASRVEGCMAQVWMTAEKKDDRFYFKMDSDAHIVKGLQGVLFNLINGKTADEIKSLNLPMVFTELGLADHLSPNRRNGFYAMVERIHHLVQ